jgi:hypothetical protein
MDDELGSIRDNNTWKLVDLPNNHKAIGLKWVYKIKKDAEEKLVKHKARLVAKGYVQGLGRSVCSGCKDGIGEITYDSRGSRILEITSYGCEIRVFEWGVRRRRLCETTTGIHQGG